MNVFTFDLETENHRYLKQLATPFDPKNYVVQIGWSINGGERFEKYYTEWHRDNILPSLDGIDVINGFNVKFDLKWVWNDPELKAFLKRGGRIYCGQLTEYLLNGMEPESHMCSMNDIAEKYGGGCKVDAVKEMWEDGYLTSQIPRDLLTSYLIGNRDEGIVGDVHNTWLIMIGQMNRAVTNHPPEFLTMLNHRFDSLLATTEMEMNGMCIDEVIAERNRLELVEKVDEALETLNSFIPETPDEFTFNWGSGNHKSALIFGGTVSYKKFVPHRDANNQLIYPQMDQDWPLFISGTTEVHLPPEQCIKAGDLYVVEIAEGAAGSWVHKGKSYLSQAVFKGGKRKGEGKFKKFKVPNTNAKPKGKIKDLPLTFEGYVKPKPAWLGKKTDFYGEPVWSVSGDVIEELITERMPFTEALQEHTAKAKDLSTYYWVEDGKKKNPDGTPVKKGMLTLVDTDGIIHHSLLHVSTVTARMSSRDPNMQNIPRGDTSDVKKMFVSRFKGGKLAEIDYSQLEVVIQGVLTRDKQLMDDLNNRVDFHCKRLAMKLGEEYDDVKHKAKVLEIPEYVDGRTGAKRISFQKAYGAGVPAMAASLGMHKDDVQAIVDADALLYPAINTFDKMLEDAIIKNASVTDNKLFVNNVPFTQRESYWDSPTGTRYSWRQEVTPEWMHKHGKYVGFKPTERKNYPFQGFGGEVMQTMLGKVWRHFVSNDNYGGRALLINTVHDCILVDAEGDVAETAARDVQRIMETVPEVFNAAFPKLRVEVPFPAEAEIGDDLFDMHVLK